MPEIILCKYCQKNPAKKYSKYSSGEFCSKECARGFSTKEKRNIINTVMSIKSGGTGNLKLPPEPMQPRRRVDSFETVLFNIIHNNFLYGEDKNYYEWALIEGLRRLNNTVGLPIWEFTDGARKDHTCIRGCKIPEGGLYFKFRFNDGFGDYEKLCVGCFALILYHQPGTYITKPYRFSHYDLDAKKPCFYDEEKEWEQYREKHAKWRNEVEKIKSDFLRDRVNQI